MSLVYRVKKFMFIRVEIINQVMVDFNLTWDNKNRVHLKGTLPVY